MVLKNSVAQLANAIAKRSLLAILLIVIARKGGVMFLGQYTLVFTLNYVFNQIAGFGTTQITIREIAKDRSKAADILWNALSIRLILSVMAILVVIMLTPFLAKDDETRRAIYVFSLAIIPLNLGDLAQAVFCGFERMQYCAYLSLIQWGIVLVASLVALSWGAGLVFLMAIQVLGFWIAAGLGLRWVVQQFVPIKVSHGGTVWKALLRESYPLGLSLLFGVLYYRIGIFLLSAVKGESAVGLFAPTIHLIDAAQLIDASLMAALYPLISRRCQEALNDSDIIVRNCSKYLVIVAALLILATSAFGREALILLLGPKFLAAVPVMQLGVWATIPMFVNFTLQTYFMAFGRQDIILKATALVTVVSIIAYYYFIRLYGPIGASAAMIICEMSLLGLSCLMGRKIVALAPLFRSLVLPGVALVLGWITLRLCDWIFAFPGHQVFSVLVFVLILLLSGAIRKEEIVALGGGRNFRISVASFPTAQLDSTGERIR